MKNVIIFSTFTHTPELSERVKSMVPKKATIAYIPAGIHDLAYAYHTKEHDVFYHLGFHTVVQAPVGVKYIPTIFDHLEEFDAVALGGGNTFEFLYMLQCRKLLPKLRDFANSGKIIMGQSAGGIMMCPKIRIAGFADRNYMELGNLDALNLVDFEVKPHWDFWSNARQIFEEYANIYNVRLLGLSEGQAIWVNDHIVRYYGGMPDFIRK